MFYFDNSAKVAEHKEITPQSNYVVIYEDGFCLWEPRYELSIIQCSIDETWFPFDEQICELVFYAWLLELDQFDFIPIPNLDSQQEYFESNEWDLTGT